MLKVASVGLPRGARDVWEELGSRAEARYTWDLTRNTNLEWAGKWKPRCRSVVTCYITRILSIIFLSSVSGVRYLVLTFCLFVAGSTEFTSGPATAGTAWLSSSGWWG